MKKLAKLLGYLNIFRWIGWLWLRINNWLKRRFGKIEYVSLAVPPQMPALPESRGWLQKRFLGETTLSLWELEQNFQRIAADERVQGVVLYLRDLQLGLADTQSLRDSIVRLREKGKRIICFAHQYSFASYYVASAANEIILQEGGDLNTLGVGTSQVFLKDALDTIGIETDVIAISPYKSAGDTLARNDASPEVREMMNWILDSGYSTLINAIAESRNTTPDAVKAMVDHAPYTDEEALAQGYVDVVLNEEALPAHLNAKHFVEWSSAQKALLKQRRNRHSKYIAVLPVSGMIVEGESQKPPIEIPLPVLGNERMGHITVVQRVRNLMQDKNAAAVVLFIDSGGGSASASEAMQSALSELAKDRPLVVYMNNMAASGGYYIATPAQWIVAQANTITGSIGVINMKAVNGAMFEKLRLNMVEFTRGANMNLYNSRQHWSESQRQQMRNMIERIYRQFLGHVSHSRNMSIEAVDQVGGGRIWTGQQALAHGLVDEIGGLQAAIKKAGELANLPINAPIRILQDSGKALGPQLAEQANPAAAWGYMQANLNAVCSGQAQLLLPFIIK